MGNNAFYHFEYTILLSFTSHLIPFRFFLVMNPAHHITLGSDKPVVAQVLMPLPRF